MRDQAREPRQLVTLLSFMAPTPLPLAMLHDGWEAVPSPLRRTVQNPTALARLAEDLSGRGLVAADLETVTCSAGTQENVRRRLSHRAEHSACTFAVRFLRAALPANTHFHGSRPTWRPATIHLDAIMPGRGATQHYRFVASTAPGRWVGSPSGTCTSSCPVSASARHL